MHNVEARLAGGKFDDHLLALLLFRCRFGIDLMPVSSSELPRYLIAVAARAFDEVDFERRAGVFFPKFTAADAGRMPSTALPPSAAVPARKARRVG